MAARSPWSIPELWPGSTIYLIGGGPGLLSVNLELIKDKYSIAINQAFRKTPWSPVMYFGDGQFYRDNEKEIRGFSGLIITSFGSVPAIGKGWPMVRRVKRAKPYGIESTKRSSISWNNNSGASAINVAYWLGARRIVLLGLDMQPSKSGKHNWHDRYAKRSKKWNPYRRHLRGWELISKDAKRLGVEILNATPGSKIEQIPIVEFEDTL